MLGTGAVILGCSWDVPEDFTRDLHYGNPAIGWKGDPALAIVHNRAKDCWELWHHQPQPGEPDRHALVIAGPPGKRFDRAAMNTLLTGLARSDTTRRHNTMAEQFAEVAKRNAKLEEDKLDKGAEELVEPMDRVGHGLRKDLSIPRRFFGVYDGKAKDDDDTGGPADQGL